MANLSFEEIRDRIRAAVKDSNASLETNKIGMYPYRVEPDKPVTKGVTVLENYDDNKYYEYDFTIGDDGKVTLSNPNEVQKVESWSAVKSRVIAATKAKDHVLFTGTALVPGEPDCDFENGEELLTEIKVAKFAHEYIENYRIVDKEHEYLETGEEMGKPVESHLLAEATVIKSMDDVEREYPKGTWVVTSKITDPESQKLALKGELFYSVTALSKEYADKLSAKSRILIKDVPNATVFTLALTKTPCVDNSCSVKAANKSGKQISKHNKSIIEKARDAVNDAVSTLNSLIQDEADNNGGNNMSEKKEENKEFVTKSDLDAFKTDVLEAVKAAPKKPEEQAAPPAALKCPKCDAAVGAKDKFCKACGAALKKAGKSKDVDEETDLEETKSIKNHDDGKEKVSFKSVNHYAGRDARGRPVKKSKE